MIHYIFIFQDSGLGGGELLANHQDGLRALGHDVQLVAGWQRLVFGRGQVIRRGLSKWWRLVGAKPISSKGYFEMATASSINRLSEPFVERCFFRFAEVTTWCFWALKFLSQRHFLQRRVYPLGRGLPSTRFEGCLIRSRTKCFRGIWWVHWCICSCLWLVAKWLKISHTKGYDSEHLQHDALWFFFASINLNLCCAAPGIRSSVCLESPMTKGWTRALRCVAVIIGIIGFPVATGDGPIFLSSLDTQWSATPTWMDLLGKHQADRSGELR